MCPLQPSNPHLWHLTLLILPFSSPTPSRQGQGAVVQVLAEPLLFLLLSLSLSLSCSLSRRGRAACSGKNLCGDRCAYQTPALSPVPRGSHNYLLARLLENLSNAELTPFASTSCGRRSRQWAGRHRGQVYARPTATFLSPGLSASHQSLHTPLKHIGAGLLGRRGGVRGGDLDYFELFM